MAAMETLRFEARDVKPYGEFVVDSALVDGETYYVVHFLDDQMLIPELKPLVFIGRDREAGDSGTLYFQDADSYFAGARYESASGNEEIEFHTVDSNTPFVFEFECALDVLLWCSLRRRPNHG